MTVDQLTWKQWRWILLWLAQIVLISAVWLSSSGKLIGTGYVPTLIAFARLAGLLAAFTVLTQVVLVSRVTFIERDFGLDRLTRMHRWNGFAALVLVFMHVPTLILAYSTVYGVQPPEVLPLFFQNFEDTLQAFIAEILLVIVAVSSLVIARKRLRYEWWYAIHLLTYLVVLFSFGHQIENGRELAKLEWFRTYWIALYGLVFLLVVYYRFARQLLLYKQQDFRVARIVEEASGVHSVYLRGKNIRNFHYTAGQFGKFRFLAKGFWLQEHPFSFSIEPNSDELRISVKTLGDFTASIAQLPENTRVIVDGPYGRFTTERITQKRVVYIAGGIGITPIRSMLGALAESGSQKKVWLFYSTKASSERVFEKELARISRDMDLSLRNVVQEGPKKRDIAGMFSVDVLKKELKNLSGTDFYICGPPGMMRAIKTQLLDAGVAPVNIHTEEFSLVKS